MFAKNVTIMHREEYPYRYVLQNCHENLAAQTKNTRTNALLQ